MGLIDKILWPLVLLGILIIVHELGHYWAARFFDVKVEVFSFGFGPRLFGFRKGETDFRFSAILFGGYVKMYGEQPGEDSADPRSFLGKPRWQRLIIAFAGPAINIVLAVAVMATLFTIRYPKEVAEAGPAVVGHVDPDSAAARAGLQAGDRIVQVADQANPTWDDIMLKAAVGGKGELTVGVERDGRRLAFQVQPGVSEKTGEPLIGWSPPIRVNRVMPGLDAERQGLREGDVITSINGAALRSYQHLVDSIRNSKGQPVEVAFLRNGARQTVRLQPALIDIGRQKVYMVGVDLSAQIVMTQLGVGEAIAESVKHNVKNALLIYQVLKGIVERRISPRSLEGPIGIADIASEAAKRGALEFFATLSMVSLNLAVFNLLPIPVLDGGTILMLLVEMVMRRDLSLRVREAVVGLGFTFLLCLVGFILYSDISKRIAG